MFKYLALLATLLVMQSCSQLYDWQTKYADNYAEEVIEDFIESKTGKNIDLTPITGEERQSFISK